VLAERAAATTAPGGDPGGPEGGGAGDGVASAWASGWPAKDGAGPGAPAGVWTSDAGGAADGRGNSGHRAQEADSDAAGGQRDGERPVTCTKEIDNLAELHDAMLNSGPEEIICVRGPRTTPAALSAVAFARSQLGEPYVWGGNGRRDGGFDCSGLTSASYASAGVPIPRTAQAQYNAGPRLAPDQPIQAGDLVFFGSGPRGVVHVGMAISPTQMINAPDEGQVVSIGPIHRRDFVGATRPASSASAGH
jgi:cell wall-associated NlpC family hydrolase